MTEYIDRLHPLTLFGYFVSVMGLAMFIRHPGFQIISFLAAILVSGMLARDAEYGGKRLRGIVWSIVLFFVIALINPLVSHNGATVLFYINGARITLEAIIYGVVTAIMLMGVLRWCRALSYVMNSNRLIYLLGRLSARAALLCSMVIRFVPNYRRQAAVIRGVQRQLGLYGSNSLPERLRAECRVFSAMVTWSFEHSVNTADSMQARGYGSGKRTIYHDNHICIRDVVLLIAEIFLTAATICVITTNKIQVLYYPYIHIGIGDPWLWIGLVLYATLTMLLPGYYFCKRVNRSKYDKKELHTDTAVGKENKDEPIVNS